VTNDTDPATVERAPRLTKAAVGLVRPVIEGVRPQVDCGRYPAKASIGEPVIVEADIFCDGHDALSCEVRHRPPGARAGRAWRWPRSGTTGGGRRFRRRTSAGTASRSWP